MRIHGLLACVALVLCPSSATLALSGRLEVAKGEFRLHLDDGRVIEKATLVGHRIVLSNGGQEQPVLIAAVEEDVAGDGETILLYRLLTENPVSKTQQNICQPDPRGRQLAFPVAKESGFDITCTSGAEGKCILMGYRPWDERPDIPMRTLHQACIHAVRADYGGDNHPSTRDGTLIDLYDRYGIRKAEETELMPFEAAWGADGALCIAHPRIAENITLADLAGRYPGLVGHLGPASCREEMIWRDPKALLFNRSAAPAP